MVQHCAQPCYFSAMIFDLLIVGGGINGTAIAREAALNGLKVLLVERDDLAQHTSSASTKLIHGGLRYLEYFEFGLVREALKERERLLHLAPHLIHPMRFILPHVDAIRPWWLVRAGLLLYDWIGGRISLPRSRGLRRSDAEFIRPLKKAHKGFVYSDCTVDDARLTLSNALDAAECGADIRLHTELISAQRNEEHWSVKLSDGQSVLARGIVNAAGPWVEHVLGRLNSNTPNHVRLVRGSHIIVPSIFEGDHAYMLQQPDRRIVFAISYESNFTLIGTTDIAVETPEEAEISTAEITYLCDAANRYFTNSITADDVIVAFAGIRPLYDDGAQENRAVTRDYTLDLDMDGPPLLSVFGGKITTARHLAEDAFGRLAPLYGLSQRYVTRERCFPGGCMKSFDALLSDVQAQWPFLGPKRSRRMVQAYGTHIQDMLKNIASESGMGVQFGAGFTEIEASWMHDREWARSAEDCLDRRSKLRLHLTPAECLYFTRWWKERFGENGAPRKHYPPISPDVDRRIIEASCPGDG